MASWPHTSPPRHDCGEGDRGGGGGDDVTHRTEELSGLADRPGEVPGEVGESGQDEVAERVAGDVAGNGAVTGGEAVAEELGPQRRLRGEGEETAADVARAAGPRARW